MTDAASRRFVTEGRMQGSGGRADADGLGQVAAAVPPRLFDRPPHALTSARRDRSLRSWILPIVLGLAGVTRAGLAQASSTVDSAAIVSARATYEEVRALAEDRELSVRDSTFACGTHERAAFALRIERDARGVLRRLTATGGGEDSAGEIEYYYDSRGRLRFAFQSTSAVNGTTIELRRYFDEGGATIRRLRRVVSGPGYPADDVPVVLGIEHLPRAFCAQPAYL